MNRRLGGFCLAGVVGMVVLFGCAPTSSEVGVIEDTAGGGGAMNESDGGMQPPQGSAGKGPVACMPGESRLAADGCNTCTCSDDGSWACTLVECPTCKDGETTPAGDGCNTCSCMGGDWACTEKACATCTVGDTQSDACSSCICADFGDGPTWACTSNVCMVCKPMTTRAADDGCNTCTCDANGQWQCTTLGCAACKQGEMKLADDGCNTCTCDEKGNWACTLLGCNIMCAAGDADCDGDPTNGCETKLFLSVDNCGTCGTVCDLPGATAKCDGGKCQINSCTAGYADCNGDPTDGCEAVVGPGGCAKRCDPVAGTPEPTPAGMDCSCPDGMACVHSSADHPGEDYCYPLTDSCPSYGTCGCLGTCVCPNPNNCLEMMAMGGKMNIDCHDTLR